MSGKLHSDSNLSSHMSMPARDKLLSDPLRIAIIPQHAGPCTEMILDVSFEGCFSEKDCNDQKSFDLLYDDKDNPVMWLGLPVYSHKESSRYMFFDGNYWNVMQVYDGSSDYIFYHLSKYAWRTRKTIKYCMSVS